MIKKIIALILAVLCIVSLTACKKEEAEVSSPSTSSTVATSNKESATNSVTSSETTPSSTIGRPVAIEKPESVNPTETEPSTSTTKPSATQTTETFPDVEEIVDFTIPEVDEPEDEYVIKNVVSNISDNEGLSKFTYNGKEYNLTTLTSKTLNNAGIYLSEEDVRFYTNNSWTFEGDLYGFKNNKGKIEKPFYLELSKSNEVEAIAVDKEDGKNITFFRNIKCGMTSEEIAPLLEGANKKQTRSQTIYLFKDNNNSLMIEMQNGVVEFVILVKNSSMKDWKFYE